MLGVQPVHRRLHRRDQLVVAGLDDPRVVCAGRAVRRPVQGGQELHRHLARQRHRQQRGQAERRPDQHREDVDPHPGKAECAGKRLTPGCHDDTVVCAVPDGGNDRDALAQREPDEAAVGAEVDAGAVGPWSAGVVVAAREDDDGRAVSQRGPGRRLVGRECTAPAQQRADSRDGEQ